MQQVNIQQTMFNIQCATGNGLMVHKFLYNL